METQKPLKALIFVNGDSNDGPMVRRALAAAPDAWVLAADGGARQAAHFGLNVQTVIGDMDSLSTAELDALSSRGAHIHRYPQEKDETDLELTLLHAAGANAVWIRIIAAIGDRLDQTLSNIYLMALPALAGRDVRMVAGKQEAWLLSPGETLIYGAPGDTLSLLPLTGMARGVRTEHLYYPLRDETLVFGPARGISNVMQSDTARVWLGEGVLLAVHTIGKA
ncbi:MAG: thiamine diphosphokinase [Anaerolineae bacterium]|nr:thiamine diphosphokinase [Anaerolineae bacterium]